MSTHPPPFTIRLPAELRDALDHAAAADHRTTAALIRKILSEWLRKHAAPSRSK